MKLDPAKLAKQRQRLGYSQLNVADKSKVNIRTVQRAEAGVSISHENAASIAAALQAKLQSLLLGGAGSDNAAPLGKTITLRHATSGRAIIDTLDQTLMGVIDCEVEATKDNLALLKKVADLLEGNMRYPLDYERSQRRSRSLSERLDLIATLNDALNELEDIGISVFMAERWLEAYLPEYDSYRDAYYYPAGKQAIGCRAVQFVISEQSSEKIARPAWVLWPLSVVHDDDECPF